MAAKDEKAAEKAADAKTEQPSGEALAHGAPPNAQENARLPAASAEARAAIVPAPAPAVHAEFAHQFVALMQQAVGIAAPQAAPVAPPPSSETDPGGKFFVKGRWVFNDGSPYRPQAQPPLHDPAQQGYAGSVLQKPVQQQPEPMLKHLEALAALPPAPVLPPGTVI